MGRVIVAGYRPKPGFDCELEKLVRSHHSTLLAEGLATDRPSLILRSKNGTLIEIYEVTKSYTKENTARNPRVTGLWRLMDDICTYVPPGRLEEMQNLFPEFPNISE